MVSRVGLSPASARETVCLVSPARSAASAWVTRPRNALSRAPRATMISGSAMVVNDLGGIGRSFVLNGVYNCHLVVVRCQGESLVVSR